MTQRFLSTALVASALMFGSGFAQQGSFLVVASGAQGTTSADMFKNLGQVCSGTAFLRERSTSGSIENLGLLLDKQASLAFVQLDVLKVRAQVLKDPRTKEILTLLALNQDELHLIAKKSTKAPVGGGGGVTKFSDLAGKKLGAWGGSFVTATVLKTETGLAIQVTPYPERKDALAALSAGQVDAVLAVVGQPADWVAALDPQQYSLLPLDIKPDLLAAYYNKATLNYPKFGGPVETYSVRRLLVARNFKGSASKAQLLKYQACAKSRLSALQTLPGMHPKWKDVTFKGGDWPIFK